MPDSKPKHNARTALLEVMKSVSHIEKDGRMQNYEYASEEAFLTALRPLFIEHGLIIYPSVPENYYLQMRVDTYTTKSGANMNLVTIERLYVISHPESDTVVRVHAFGQGTDAGDKAAGKAMTNALKYALRQSLMLVTGDDPDHASSQTQIRAGEVSGRMEGMTDAEYGSWKIKYKQGLDKGLDDNLARERANEAYLEYKRSQ